MIYFAKIEQEESYYTVSFPDFPDIMTYGHTLEEAKNNAFEALNGSVESDFGRGFDMPDPSKLNGDNCYPIKLLARISVAVTIRKLRKSRTQIEIANKLGITYQAYQKLENPRSCNPTIKTLEKIAKVFNTDFDLIFSPP